MDEIDVITRRLGQLDEIEIISRKAWLLQLLAISHKGSSLQLLTEIRELKDVDSGDACCFLSFISGVVSPIP